MQFEKWVNVNLDNGVAETVDLGKILYEGDTDPLKLGVVLYNKDGDVEITGEAAGRCITADGRTLSPLTHGEDGNRGWVIVPQDALTTPGKIEVFLRVADTNSTAVTLYAYATVKRTTTGRIVNPGDPLPSVEQLQQAASDCQTATAAAQAVAGAGIASVAETKSYLGLA